MRSMLLNKLVHTTLYIRAMKKRGIYYGTN